MNFGTFGGMPVVSSADKISWSTVALILSILGAFLIYFLFVKPEKKYNNKFLDWLRSFLNFDTILIDVMFKLLYIFAVLNITLTSFDLISVSFYSFLYYLIYGNIIARIVYELGMVLFGIWKNTREINNKTK